jgi:hypothetical protein
MDVLASLDILAIIGAKHLAQVYLQWLSLCAEMRLLFTRHTVYLYNTFQTRTQINYFLKQIFAGSIPHQAMVEKVE